MTNKRRRTADKWYFYVAWAVAAIFLWVWLIQLLIAPTAAETIAVYVGSTNSVGGIREMIAREKAPQIRKVDVQNLPDDNYLVTYYEAFGRNGCDLCILTAEQATTVIAACGNGFASIDDIVGASYEGCYEQNGVCLGAPIRSEVFEDTGETYYVFLCKNSVHIGALGNGTADGYAIELFRKMVSE